MRDELARELFSPSSGTVVALVWNSQKWVNSGGGISVHIEALPLYIIR